MKENTETGWWNGLRQQHIWGYSDLNAESKKRTQHFPHHLWKKTKTKLSSNFMKAHRDALPPPGKPFSACRWKLSICGPLFSWRLRKAIFWWILKGVREEPQAAESVLHFWKKILCFKLVRKCEVYQENSTHLTLIGLTAVQLINKKVWVLWLYCNADTPTHPEHCILYTMTVSKCSPQITSSQSQ